jgi:hypothetical protein
MKGVKRETDIALGWVERDYPQLAAWRVGDGVDERRNTRCRLEAQR